MAMQEAVPDPVWWALTLSDAAGRPSQHEVESWTLPQIARALIVAEAVEDRARYDRAVADHEAAARSGR